MQTASQENDALRQDRSAFGPDETPGPCCEICGCPLDGLPLVECAECGTPAHSDCFRYAKICPVFACGSTRAQRPKSKSAVSLEDTGAEQLRLGFDASGSGRERSPQKAIVFPASTPPCQVARALGLAVAVGSFLMLAFGGAVPFGGMSQILSIALISAGSLGAAVAFASREEVCIDPSTRSVRRRIGLLGTWWSSEMFASDPVRCVGLWIQPYQPGYHSLGRRHYSVRIVLFGKGGRPLWRSEAAGSREEDARPQLRRRAARIARILDVPLVEEHQQPVAMLHTPRERANGRRRSSGVVHNPRRSKLDVFWTRTKMILFGGFGLASVGTMNRAQEPLTALVAGLFFFGVLVGGFLVDDQWLP